MKSSELYKDGHTKYLQDISLPIYVNSIYQSGDIVLPSDVSEMHIGKVNKEDALIITPSIVSTPYEDDLSDDGFTIATLRVLPEYGEVYEIKIKSEDIMDADNIKEWVQRNLCNVKFYEKME